MKLRRGITIKLGSSQDKRYGSPISTKLNSDCLISNKNDVSMMGIKPSNVRESNYIKLQIEKYSCIKII